jgi:hypothetical protein
MHRFFSLGVAWLSAGAAVLTAAHAVAGGSLLCGTAGDELVAGRAGLVREWVVQVPFDSAGYRVENVSIGDGLVVATSGQHAEGDVERFRALGFAGFLAKPYSLEHFDHVMRAALAS